MDCSEIKCEIIDVRLEMLYKVRDYLLKIYGSLLLRKTFAFPLILHTGTFIITTQFVDQSEDSIILEQVVGDTSIDWG